MQNHNIFLTSFDMCTYCHGALGLPTKKDGNNSAFM